MEDELIMREVREGDVGKLETLFDRHYQGLFRYFLYLTGNRAASEDLAQEAFFRILKYRHTYQPDAGFRAWLYQIGRNVYADYLGKQKPEVALAEDAGEIRGSDAPADRQVPKKQEALLLRRALASLPGEKGEVVIMSRFLDLKDQEIASLLQCDGGAGNERVCQAVAELSC